MAIKARKNRRASERADAQRELIKRYFPAWVMLGALLVTFLPQILTFTVSLGVDVVKAVPGVVVDAAGSAAAAVGDVAGGIGDLFGSGSPVQSSGDIAPLFTEEVTYWSDDISRWAEQWELDPDLLATVMQIESCGHPTVSSHAGAQGLFQVMPFHFASGENQLDPETNAARGAEFLATCLDMAEGDPGMAMACYNGGPSVLYKDMSAWLDEPRRYYYWGTGIYADAQVDSDSSQRLDEWLDAGGDGLCNLASAELGLN